MNTLSLKVFVSLMGIAMFTLNASETLLKIDNEPVSSKEFLYIYEKNNIDEQADFSKESLESYLKLFVNYKLKVKQAIDLGVDQDPILKQEYEGYRRQLLESQVQKEVLEPLIQQEYLRSLRDIGMAHIFIDLSTTDGYKKIQEAHDKLKKGQSFEKVAEEYSEDEISKYKGGFVGYFSALQISIPEIEDAIYNTSKGHFSDIVTTEKGYHIFKVVDDRPARGQIKIAIIKLNIPEQEDMKSAVKTRADSIYQVLQADEEAFSKLAMQHSDDVGSKMHGGELDWFGINTYVREFEDAAFGLEEDGDVSTPFATDKAWYIIRRIKLADESSKEDAKRIIKTKLSSSRMYAKNMYDFYESLKAISHLKLYEDEITALKEKLTPIINQQPLAYELNDGQSPLLSINHQTLFEKDLKSLINAQLSKASGKSGREKVEEVFDQVIRELLLNSYEQKLIDSLYEYGALLDEYKNGVLIFETTKNNVWDKAVKDTLGLQKFYKNSGDKYVWNPRAEVINISAEDTIRIKDLLKMIKRKKLNSMKRWEAYLAKHPDIHLSLDHELVEKGVSPKSEDVIWSKGVHTDRDGNLYQVVSIIPSQKKDLSDIRGKVVTDYQEFLENEWLRKLNKSYKVEVNDNALQKLVK